MGWKLSVRDSKRPLGGDQTSMDGKDLAKLLRRIAEALERSSPSDVAGLLAGRASVVISPGSAGGRRNEGQQFHREKRRQRSAKDLAGLGAQLKQLESRDDGVRLLMRAQLTKLELEDLARLMDLPVLKEDDVDRLRQKIIQASIGARLNSQAITGR